MSTAKTTKIANRQKKSLNSKGFILQKLKKGEVVIKHEN